MARIVGLSSEFNIRNQHLDFFFFKSCWTISKDYFNRRVFGGGWEPCYGSRWREVWLVTGVRLISSPMDVSSARLWLSSLLGCCERKISLTSTKHKWTRLPITMLQTWLIYGNLGLIAKNPIARVWTLEITATTPPPCSIWTWFIYQGYLGFRDLDQQDMLFPPAAPRPLHWLWLCVFIFWIPIQVWGSDSDGKWETPPNWPSPFSSSPVLQVGVEAYCCICRMWVKACCCICTMQFQWDGGCRMQCKSHWCSCRMKCKVYMSCISPYCNT